MGVVVHIPDKKCDISFNTMRWGNQTSDVDVDTDSTYLLDYMDSFISKSIDK